MKLTKRMFTLITVLAILVSSLSFSAFAATPDTAADYIEKEEAAAAATYSVWHSYGDVIAWKAPTGVSSTVNVYRYNQAPAVSVFSTGASGYGSAATYLGSGTYIAILTVGGAEYKSAAFTI